MRRIVERSFVVAALVVLAVGCGGGGPPLISVTGVVTYNGSPVANASVMFSPPDTAKGIPPASGTTNEKGEFTLSSSGKTGVAAGTFDVTVTAVEGKAIAAEDVSKATDPSENAKKMAGSFTKMLPTGEGDDKKMNLEEAKSRIPTKYNAIKTSGLQYPVKAGEKNHFEIKLTD